MTRLFSRVLVLDEEGRFLCVQQLVKGKTLWNFPGGKIEPGEKPDAAARRELHEELGIDVPCLHPLGRETFKIDKARWFGFFYLAPYYRGEAIIREPDKLTDVSFFRYDQMSAFPAIHSVFSKIAHKLLFDTARTDLFCHVFTAGARKSEQNP